MGLEMRKSLSPHTKSVVGSQVPATQPLGASAQEMKEQSPRGKLLPIIILLTLSLCVVAFVSTTVSIQYLQFLFTITQAAFSRPSIFAHLFR